MSYLQAVVIGLLQGVTELFPVSSLGHSVLLPAWLGWHTLVGDQAKSESPYLAFLVGLHVATAVALLVHYRRDWAAIIRGFFRSLRARRVESTSERMAWLLVVATIPVGVVGLAFEHKLRTIFAKPIAAAIFLTINGVILLAGEWLRRRQAAHKAGATLHDIVAKDLRTIDQLTLTDGISIGSAQILALFAGISRSGVTMVAGLIRGLDHEHAAKFSFMLATPVILAAGLYKLPDLLGPNGDSVRGQVIVGSIVAGFAAYGAVRFLERFFRSNTLVPFAVYCLVIGAVSIVRFA